MLKLFDTYEKELIEFKPIHEGKVGLYTCGPTVYDYAHIGNMRTFIMGDLLVRSLRFLGYDVKQVMNITDVGHLTNDETDNGEDKLEKGAKRENKTVWEVAAHYTNSFLDDIRALNILEPDEMPKATDHIKEMIEVVKILEQKGFTYETDQAVYFEVAKFPDYEKLTGQKLEDRLVAARDDVYEDKEKKHPADFALWFKTVGRFADHSMRWDSPWGDGFPGWHIECSAMSRKYLGQPFDIHTGGKDLSFLHHPNEIAQSQNAFDAPLANYWLHGEFISVEGHKMSKSLGNLYTLKDIMTNEFAPLDYRYLVLTAHYRTKLNFTWEALEAAANALAKLQNEVQNLGEPSQPEEKYIQQFKQTLENDFNIPQALSVLWTLLADSEVPNDTKRATVNEFDKVFGLNLSQVKPLEIPQEIQLLVTQREQARESKDWQKADQLRQQIEKQGYAVEDTPAGPRVVKS